MPDKTKPIRIRPETHVLLRKIMAHAGDKNLVELVQRLAEQEWARHLADQTKPEQSP